MDPLPRCSNNITINQLLKYYECVSGALGRFRFYARNLN